MVFHNQALVPPARRRFLGSSSITLRAALEDHDKDPPQEMRKALPMEAPFVFVAAVTARAQNNSGFRAISRFPNPNEVKTSPKSWR
ncbi:hypothetical protein [Bradyrhizobium sp. 170]|uniref:hypothetical protein n=1 Tax=Bradyrhizobium sp. 170 TaxID=2782641 RepID=UPI001FFEB80E|nr:hypothetical protein [Bradyrhizobium sp. 170]UPK07412.1 hypothetical protein IVB05_19000 [Bradyrhizobium sp. 170]